jgi:molybdate transport system substrate-binding protein
MHRFARRVAALIVAAAALAPATLRADPVVFAAASLREALDAAAEAFVRERGGARPVLSYAASPALARQIEQGAPADVFVSADRAWMDHLERGGHLRAGTRTTLASNRLVLVGPVSGPAPTLRIEPGFPLAAALGPDGRLAVGDVAAVPAGRYARAALESLGVWPSVTGRLAQAENVRVALALVARGEAPLGIVYATDARAEPKLRIIGTFPETSHPPIVYPAAVTAESRSPRARAFVEFLRSPAGVALFAAHGFAAAPR